jgi:hypothetical protein
MVTRVRNEADEHRARMAEVMQGVDIGEGKPADQIQADILAAYAARGYEPPTDFSWWSRVLAAGTGRRGTRTVRLAAEAARGLGAARERLADASTTDSLSETDRLHNEKELRGMRRGVGVFVALAVSAAVGAHLTKGTVRAVLVGLSGGLVMLAAWVALWASLLGSIRRTSEATPDRLGR